MNIYKTMQELAAYYHRNQIRKGEAKTPYIVHPESVAKTLMEWGVSPSSDLIAIAWGHDLLEDTTVTPGEILAVSNEKVLHAIERLTCPENMEKSRYIAGVAQCGDPDVLLVKIADRICNSKDFVKLNGPLYAHYYLHKADLLVPALEKFSGDQIVRNALNAFRQLSETLRKDSRREAVCGCLIGGAVGDALGSPVEFLSTAQIKKIYGGKINDYVEFGDSTGSITDDTQMTLFTVEGILRAQVRGREKGICDPVGVMIYAYWRWLKTQGITPDSPAVETKWLDSGFLIKEKQLFAQRAPGMTCLDALQTKRSTACHTAQNQSKGCGTVMRMAPAGLFFEPERAYEYGCKYSAITHGHPTGITSGGAFAMLLAYLMEGKELPVSLDLTSRFLRNAPGAEETLQALEKARSASSIEELGEGWVAEEALAIGVYCALHHTWDFKKGVLEAVNITGDSDSTGSIAGNILGVLNGLKQIPLPWQKNLREYPLVLQVAEDLACGFQPDKETGHVSAQWQKKYPGY